MTTFTTELKNRDDIPLLLNELGLTGVGVEVGTAIGHYANSILQNSKLSHLIAIDNYTIAKNQEEADRYYLWAVTRLLQYTNRASVWNINSVDAAVLIQDESLDFIYIDADHKYESISKDIESWWPKIKRGGIFSGHDYCEPHIIPKFGVKKAVDEFQAKTNLDLHLVGDKLEKLYSWLFIKPKGTLLL